MLLISLLMLTQVHLCEGSCLLPNGQACIVCPELDETSCNDLGDHTSSLGAIHGDCHDCCVFAACDNNSSNSPVAASGWIAPEIVICFPPKVKISFPCKVLGGAKRIHVASAPITGPPIQRSSRAPPSTTNLLSSRWTQFVNA